MFITIAALHIRLDNYITFNVERTNLRIKSDLSRRNCDRCAKYHRSVFGCSRCTCKEDSLESFVFISNRQERVNNYVLERVR